MLKLNEWLKNYLKHKDISSQDILEFQDDKDGYSVVVKRKRENQFVIITEKLSLHDIKGKIENKPVILLTLNLKENVKELISNWKYLAQQPKLLFIFLNLEKDTKWIISPYTHNLIADFASLEKGIWSMFENS